jgi:hypothetical protein
MKSVRALAMPSALTVALLLTSCAPTLSSAVDNCVDSQLRNLTSQSDSISNGVIELVRDRCEAEAAQDPEGFLESWG